MKNQTIEEGWKQSLPRLNLAQWVGVFPESKECLKEKLVKLKRLRGLLSEEVSAGIDRTEDYDDPWSKLFWLMKIKYFTLARIRKVDKEIVNIQWAIRPKIKSPNGITDEDIARARAFPFEQLIKVNSRGFALCPFHKDSRPSFYTKNNFGYCFSCGKACDSIQFVMETEGLSFKETVKKLS